MPMPVAHGLVGASLVAAVLPRADARRYRLALVAGALLANAADGDFLLVVALGSRAWHRGFTHSLAFALVFCAAAAAALGARRLREALALGLAYASHSLLDYATTVRGGGVELFWPFWAERLALGWRGLSEIPSGLPPGGVLWWLAVEFALFAPPLAALLVLRRRLSRRGTKVVPL